MIYEGNIYITVIFLNKVDIKPPLLTTVSDGVEHTIKINIQLAN